MLPKAMIPSEAFCDRRLRGEDLRILGLICAHTTPDRNEARMSAPTLADLAGVHLRSIRRSIARLKEAGWIRESGRSKYGVCIYAVMYGSGHTNMEGGDSAVTPGGDSPVTPSFFRGDTDVTPDRAPVSPEYSLEEIPPPKSPPQGGCGRPPSGGRILCEPGAAEAAPNGRPPHGGRDRGALHSGAPLPAQIDLEEAIQATYRSGTGASGSSSGKPHPDAVQALISAGLKREQARLIAAKQLQHRSLDDFLRRVDGLIAQAFSARAIKRELAADLKPAGTGERIPPDWTAAPAANVGERDRAAARRVDAQLRARCGSAWSGRLDQLRLQRVNGAAVYLAPTCEIADLAELYRADLARLWRVERADVQSVTIERPDHE